MSKWVNAGKQYPERRSVVILRRIGETEEKFALWNGDDYYIFNVLKCEWADWNFAFARWFDKEIPAPVSDFEWSYAEKGAYLKRPFYALAEAKRSQIPYANKE